MDLRWTSPLLFAASLLAVPVAQATPRAALPDTLAVATPLREFPNPFSDHLTFTMPQGLRGNTRAQLVDEAGRVVNEWPLGFAEEAGAPVTLSTAGLVPGLYVLRLLDEWGAQADVRLTCE